jgi:hypothetical protein
MPSRVYILFAVLALALVPCVGAAEDGPVAVVNGEAVGRDEFGRALVESLGRSAAQAFVDLALLEQEARRRGIAVTDGELAARRELELELRLQALPRAVRMGPEEFRLATERGGLDMAERRRALEEGISEGALRGRLLAERLLAPGLDLSDEALRSYYERTRGPQYAAAHIEVAGRRLAEDLLGLLEADLRLWQRAVLRHSLDRRSVPDKGRIGPVPAGSELGRVLAGMEPGELKLWQGDGRWHVLRFIRAVPASGEEFDAVRDRLRAELTALECESRYEALLAELNAGADVVVNLGAEPEARRLLGEQVALFVNGEPVTVRRMADVLLREFGPVMIGPYVERLLVVQEAARMGVSVSEEEMAERLAAVADQLMAEEAARRRMGPDGLVASLARRGADAAEFKAGLVRRVVSREDVRATLLAEKLVADGVEVTEAEIAEAYGELHRDRLLVRELVTDSLPRAERMWDKLREGLSFEVVARTETAEPGAWVQGGLRRLVSSAHPCYGHVKHLREGELSGVFKEGGRYRIMQLLRRDPPSEPPPLDSVRESLAREVRLRKARGRMRALLVRLRAEADIEVRLD